MALYSSEIFRNLKNLKVSESSKYTYKFLLFSVVSDSVKVFSTRHKLEDRADNFDN